MSLSSRNPARSVTGRATTGIQTKLHQLSDPEELSRALDSSRRQLEEAVRKNDELLQLRSLLTEKVSSLEFALAKANKFAHYDELTGLPNRRLLLDRFIQAAALANRHRQVLALLFFDVNDFKRVNDQLGHNAGDKLLQQVATRLSGSIRQSDTACRYGGDEFVVLLTEIDNREQAVTALKKIRAHLAPPYVIDRHSTRLIVTNGMAIYPEDAHSFTDLMRLSDRSMFSNKPGSQGPPINASQSNIWLNDGGMKLCVNG